MAETQQKKHRGHHEGTTKKRTDGRWEARMSLGVVNGKPKYKYYYGKTEADVKAKMREGQAGLQRDIMPGNDRLTIAVFLTSQWLPLKAQDVRPSTLRSYSDMVRLHIVPRIGQKKLAKLTPADVQMMLAGMSKDGVPLPRVRYARVVLRAALHQAERWELVHRNVAALATPPKVERKEIHYLSTEQARTFVRAVKDDPL